MGTIWQDFRFALRVLVKKPGFTAVAILSLTLGIGANSTIFTLVKAVFLQPVPIQDPSRVVVLYSTQQSRGGALQQFLPLTVPNARDYREMNDVFSGMSVVIFAGGQLKLGEKDDPVFVELVNYNYFDVMGVSITQGRTFAPSEDATPGARPVAILSYAKWVKDFGSDQNILSKTVQISGQEYAVIGVTPAEFHDVGTFGSPDFWVPLMMHDQLLTGIVKEWFNARGARMASAVARLKPNVTLQQAQASMHALGEQLAKTYPNDNAGRNNDLLPIDQTNIPPAQRSTFVLAGTLMMVTVGLVLLIACANVANLLLTRATQRKRELAIRLSLGASRSRLIRQLLTESLLLGLISGGLGILTASWAKKLVISLIPGGFPQNLDTSMDTRVVFFTIFLAIVAAVLFGLAPALQASKSSQMGALRDRTDAPGGATRWYGLRGVLVMVQVSLSLIALVGAGLFIHSLTNAQQMDPGFETKHELVIGVNPGGGALKYPQPRTEQFYKDVVDRLRSLPMVANASLSDTQPFGANFQRTTFPEGVDTADPRNGKLTPVVAVAPGYFETAGISMLSGRGFDEHDDATSQMVAVVNQAFVDRTWPSGTNPIGKHLHFLLQTWDVQIVGLVKTVKYQTLGEPPQPIVYYPLKQHYSPNAVLFVRTKGEPNAALQDIRKTIQTLEPTLPLGNVRTIQERLDQSLTAPKLGAELLGAFGILALLLAAIGTYGVMSYSVSQRTQEIGIRMALGAQRRDVLRLILGNGLAMIFGGIGVGLILSTYLTHTMNSLLYGIGDFDAVSFFATSALLLLVALFACWLPARRAMRVDPIIALRYE
jgi:putative ABC transport system permease protein